MIVTDLDGTLLPESKVLSERSRTVLQRMAELGVTICIASGKFHQLVCRYGREVGPDTQVIALDGARTGSAAQNAPPTVAGISRETALSLLEMFSGNGVELFLDDGADEMLL